MDKSSGTSRTRESFDTNSCFVFFFLKNLCALKLCRTFSDVLRESQRECTTHYTHTLAFLASGMARADGTWAGWSEVDPTLHCASTCASTAQFPTQQKKLEEKKKKKNVKEVNQDWEL